MFQILYFIAFDWVVYNGIIKIFPCFILPFQFEKKFQTRISTFLILINLMPLGLTREITHGYLRNDVEYKYDHLLFDISELCNVFQSSGKRHQVEYKLSAWTQFSNWDRTFSKMTVFCRLVVLLMSAYFAIGSRIAITNNGYDDIVIGISPDVPESNASSILSNIQVHLDHNLESYFLKYVFINLP